MARKLPPNGLTPCQARLLERHRRGLARLARVLAEKTGRDPAEIMFLLAHRDSNVGILAREQLGAHPVTGNEAVIVPGLARELPTWLAHLALAGPVTDCTHNEDGVSVIVIDERNEVALCRAACLGTAGTLDPGNRSVILSD